MGEHQWFGWNKAKKTHTDSLNIISVCPAISAGGLTGVSGLSVASQRRGRVHKVSASGKWRKKWLGNSIITDPEKCCEWWWEKVPFLGLSWWQGTYVIISQCGLSLLCWCILCPLTGAFETFPNPIRGCVEPWQFLAFQLHLLLLIPTAQWIKQSILCLDLPQATKCARPLGMELYWSVCVMPHEWWIITYQTLQCSFNTSE